jgi:hypothetical protein
MQERTGTTVGRRVMLGVGVGTLRGVGTLGGVWVMGSGCRGRCTIGDSGAEIGGANTLGGVCIGVGMASGSDWFVAVANMVASCWRAAIWRLPSWANGAAGAGCCRA